MALAEEKVVLETAEVEDGGGESGTLDALAAVVVTDTHLELSFASTSPAPSTTVELETTAVIVPRSTKD